MNLHFPPLLAVTDYTPIIVPIIVFSFILGLVAIRTIGGAKRDRYWADTARAAIDKGHPIPPAPSGRDWNSSNSSLRWTRGLIFIAVGVAFYLIPRHGLRDWAPLPICVGVAMLIIGLIAHFGSGGPGQRRTLV